MEQLAILSNRIPKTNGRKSAARLTRNSKIIKTIISAVQAKKGENIISLDLRNIQEAVADFFIICEASNQPQIRALSEYVEKQVEEKCGEKPYHQEGYKSMKWVLVDYVNVVLHIMTPETRNFYKLEDMWSDSKAEKHSD
ncbi:MAG: ribosome silencing factor [Bacteroidetes bacterium]|nr:ribosome silencing factor [Bacteroidota bacterium]MBS1931701.1 ribosome silencing factor [Bacteroidota bacterium]